MSDVYVRIGSETEHMMFNQTVRSKRYMPTGWNDMKQFPNRHVVNGICTWAWTDEQFKKHHNGEPVGSIYEHMKGQLK